MNVEHIIWEDLNWTDKNVHGVLELDGPARRRN